MMRILSAAVAVFALVLTACATNATSEAVDHLIMVGECGQLLDPTAGCVLGYDAVAPRACSNDGQYVAEQLRVEHEQLVEQVKRIVADAPLDRNRRRRVMLFAHGGLVSLASGVASANAIVRDIRTRGGDAPYIVFLDWSAALTSAYGEHVLWLRQGDRTTWYRSNGLVASPVVFAVDAAESVVRAPLAWSEWTANRSCEVNSAFGRQSCGEATTAARADLVPSHLIRIEPGDPSGAAQCAGVLTGPFEWFLGDVL